MLLGYCWSKDKNGNGRFDNIEKVLDILYVRCWNVCLVNRWIS